MSLGKLQGIDTVGGVSAFALLFFFFLLNWKRLMALLGFIALSILHRFPSLGIGSIDVSLFQIVIVTLFSSFLLSSVLSASIVFLCRSIPVVSLKLAAAAFSLFLTGALFYGFSSEKSWNWLSSPSAGEVPESKIVRVQWPVEITKGEADSTFTWDRIVEDCLLQHINHFRIRPEVAPYGTELPPGAELQNAGSEITYETQKKLTYEVQKKGRWELRSTVLLDAPTVDAFLAVGKAISSTARKEDGTFGEVTCQVKRRSQSWSLTIIPRPDGSWECWLEGLKQGERRKEP